MQVRKLAILVEPSQETTIIKDDPDDNKFLSVGNEIAILLAS